MLEHMPPFAKETAKLNPKRLIHMSSGFTNPPGLTNPAGRATGNYDAALAEIHWLGAKVNNTYLGRLWETSWWDTLVHHGIPETAIDDHVSFGWNAEADLLVHADEGDVALLLKTSMRERWKQPDRDATIIRHVYKYGSRRGRALLGIWVITLREQANTTPIQACSHARRLGELFFTEGVHVISAMDTEQVAKAIRQCGGIVEP